MILRATRRWFSMFVDVLRAPRRRSFVLHVGAVLHVLFLIVDASRAPRRRFFVPCRRFMVLHVDDSPCYTTIVLHAMSTILVLQVDGSPCHVDDSQCSTSAQYSCSVPDCRRFLVLHVDDSTCMSTILRALRRRSHSCSSPVRRRFSVLHVDGSPCHVDDYTCSTSVFSPVPATQWVLWVLCP
jgi:hypothetical protein